ncbi:MAG: nucleoside deaminase [Phycisphaerales bacterium JB039]
MDRLTAPDAAALEAAIEQAKKGLAEGGIPIGSALATADGTIIAAGHNRRVQDGDPTAHAETVCVRAAGRRRDWPGLILATTLSPCAMCSGTIVLLGIRRVIIGEHATFMGREDWLRAEGVELVVAEDARCRAMMERFIAERPSLWNEDIGVED